MKNKLVGLVVLLSVVFMFDKTFRPQEGIEENKVLTPIVLPLTEEKIKKRHQFEICRDKLYTTYPNNMNQSKWRKCMAT